jgi:NhaP-type Na+/H+ or K+/H+ antiporter
VGFSGLAFALLVVIVARPVAIGLSLLRSGIDPKEWVAAAWFGPKGFASVVYGLLVARSGVAQAEEMFRLIAVAIAVSILLHSSTDVAVARAFHRDEAEPGPSSYSRE